MSEIERMSDVQFNELALNTGFKSYRRELSLEQAQRTAKIDAWVDSMELVVDSTYIIVGENPFEDELIVPEIKSSLYRSVINEDGILYIDGIKNLVDATNVSEFYTSNTRTGEEARIETVSYVNETATRNKTDVTTAEVLCSKWYIYLGFNKHYMASFHPDGVTRKYTALLSSQTMRKRWGNWRIYGTHHYINDMVIGGGTFNNIRSSSVWLLNARYYLPDWYFANKEAFYNSPFSFKFTSEEYSTHGYITLNGTSGGGDYVMRWLCGKC